MDHDLDFSSDQLMALLLDLLSVQTTDDTMEQSSDELLVQQKELNMIFFVEYLIDCHEVRKEHIPIDGFIVGERDGCPVGPAEGLKVGIKVGGIVGANDGSLEGEVDGSNVGLSDGDNDGKIVGFAVGMNVGP